MTNNPASDRAAEHSTRPYSSCDVLLNDVHKVLSGDCNPLLRERLLANFDDCETCLDQAGVDVEVALRQILRKKCCEQAPETLRQRLRVQIRTVNITITEQRGL